MNWQAALTEIESPQFAARLNVVSDEKAFFREVAQDPVALELCRQVKDSGELQESTLDRIHDLAGQEFDRRYENPNDTPLAVLLWLTCRAAPEAGPVAAHYVARAPQCWYARKLAQRIMGPPAAAGTNAWACAETAAAPIRMLPVAEKIKIIPAAVAGTPFPTGECPCGAVS